MFQALQRLNPGAPLAQIVYYSTLWSLSRLGMSFLYSYRVFGSEHIPARGPVVVVANHQSFFDPPFMGAAFKRHLQYIARSSLFRFPLFSAVIESLNAIPISGNQTDTAVFKICERHLELGRMVLIYPEGARSEDGRVQPFKRGVLLLLRRSKAPVLPIAIEGSFANWSRYEHRPHLRGPIQVKVGELIASDTLLSLSPDEALRLMQDRVELLRVELRARLREQTCGRFPPRSRADERGHYDSK